MKSNSVRSSTVGSRSDSSSSSYSEDNDDLIDTTFVLPNIISEGDNGAEANSNRGYCDPNGADVITSITSQLEKGVKRNRNENTRTRNLKTREKWNVYGKV